MLQPSCSLFCTSAGQEQPEVKSRERGRVRKQKRHAQNPQGATAALTPSFPASIGRGEGMGTPEPPSLSLSAQPMRINTSFCRRVSRLTNHQLAVVPERVLWNLEVERGGSFPDAARDVVVGSVAGAEPTAVVARLADGYASEMCADACVTRGQSSSSSLSAPSQTIPSRRPPPDLHSRANIPSMTSHSGSLTRSSSVWGSRSDWTLTLLASSISPAVRWRTKTGLPRHLMITCTSSWSPGQPLFLLIRQARGRDSRSCPRGSRRGQPRPWPEPERRRRPPCS